MNVKWWRKSQKIKPTANPFRRVACRQPFVNRWQGSLATTPTLEHKVWAEQLREGHFRANEAATHELVVGYQLANSERNFWLLFRGQYSLEKNSTAYQICEGLAFLLLDAKSPWELRLEHNSLTFHEQFWPLAVERLYEEIRRA